MSKKTKGAAMAAQFKAQAAKVIEATSVDVRLPIPAIAPDFVFEFVGRRIDFNSMLMAGELPESFARQILEAKRQELPPDKDAALEKAMEKAMALSVEEKQENIEFQKTVAQRVCLSPRLVFREAVDDDEIDLRGVPFSGDLIIALFEWAMDLSPEVPVKLVDGEETTVKAVENFSPEAQPAELPHIEFTGAAI